jgi:hypothetical protein
MSGHTEQLIRDHGLAPGRRLGVGDTVPGQA